MEFSRLMASFLKHCSSDRNLAAYIQILSMNFGRLGDVSDILIDVGGLSNKGDLGRNHGISVANKEETGQMRGLAASSSKCLVTEFVMQNHNPQTIHLRKLILFVATCIHAHSHETPMCSSCQSQMTTSPPPPPTMQALCEIHAKPSCKLS
jgi:hypothetical protein